MMYKAELLMPIMSEENGASKLRKMRWMKITIDLPIVPTMGMFITINNWGGFQVDQIELRLDAEPNEPLFKIVSRTKKFEADLVEEILDELRQKGWTIV